MNYRHVYHAGSLDDVLKHIIEIELIQAMQHKPTPFFFLDTHAGTGIYDLNSHEAKKTRCADSGIIPLWPFRTHQHLPESVKTYFKLIHDLNHNETAVRFYPGSAWIAVNLLRSNDSFSACEWHRDACEALKHQLKKFPASIHHRDGLEAMNGLLPPKEKRALIFIDPPYEKPDEVSEIKRALVQALQKCSHGVFALWYPVKKEHSIQKLLREFPKLFSYTLHQIEWVKHEDDLAQKLLGSGVMVINPPFIYQNNIQKTIESIKNDLKIQKICRVDCRLIK